MKTISTKAIVALMTATLGLGALAPAFAQDAPLAASTEASTNAPDQQGFRPGGNGPRQGGGMNDLLGFERGAEAIEIALVRLGHRLDLTTEQTALFDTLKSTALSAAEQFATATEGLRPDRTAATETAERPDLTQRLENGIALQKARLAALETVQPALTAFYDSLTDEQKAELTPLQGQRPGNFGKRDGGPGERQGGPGAHQGRESGPRPSGNGPAVPNG